MLTRKQRKNIEMEGIPYATTIIMSNWDIPMANIELVTDAEKQINGIDYMIKANDNSIVNIDTKYHRSINRIQKRTDYGVDVLSMEIKKHNGFKGWAIDKELETDYIIDMIKGIGYYMIDARMLHDFLQEHYRDYPIAYKQEGQEDYRAVDVIDLWKCGVILYYREWSELMQTKTIAGSDANIC